MLHVLITWHVLNHNLFSWHFHTNYSVIVITLWEARLITRREVLPAADEILEESNARTFLQHTLIQFFGQKSFNMPISWCLSYIMYCSISGKIDTWGGIWAHTDRKTAGLILLYSHSLIPLKTGDWKKCFASNLLRPLILGCLPVQDR